jgi:hypothetical protein
MSALVFSALVPPSTRVIAAAATILTSALASIASVTFAMLAMLAAGVTARLVVSMFRRRMFLF